MLDFYILNLSAFAPGLHTQEDWRKWAEGGLDMGTDAGEVPDISFVPAMLRRRLSQNIKMALYVAYHSAGDLRSEIRAVFASRFGEWQQTAKLLTTYFNEDMISPMGFGLSVHNAASGINSLINENKAPCSAISAGEGTFSAGMIEALTSAKENEKILYVYSDEATPEIYRGIDERLQCAVGLVLSKARHSSSDRHVKYSLNHKGADGRASQAAGINDPTAFMRFYLCTSSEIALNGIYLKKG